MAAGRDLTIPLVIFCLVFTRGYSPMPTMSQVPGMNPMRHLKPRGFSAEDFAYATEDYTQYEDTVTTVLPKRVSPQREPTQRCNYNPCLEDQTPCATLAASTGCLCPGLTLHNVVPEAPNLKSVSWNGSEVTVQWCAPYSYVTAYAVTVGGRKWLTFGKDQRSGAVGDIDHITEVCVIAMNDSGDSDGSCMMYHPKDNSLPLKAGLIGGALGFLLLLLLGVLLWRHKRQRRQEASISMHDTAETQ